MGRSNNTELVWGGVSQIFSSATNFGFSFIAARALGPDGLGAVYVGFSLFLMLLALQRSLVSDPLIALTTVIGDQKRQEAQRSSLTLLLVLYSGAAALTAISGAYLPESVGAGLLIIAPFLPMALLQDYWRNILFQQRRGRQAAINDLSWLMVMGVTAPLGFAVQELWAVIVTWGAGALVACLLGFIQTRVTPTSIRSGAQWWLSKAKPMGGWLGLGSIVTGVTSQIVVFTLAFQLGTAPLGGLRAVQSVFAPLSLIGGALALPGLPELTKRVGTSVQVANRYAIQLGVVAAILTTAYGGLVAIVGADLLASVFGAEFGGFEPLIWPVALTQLVGAALLGFPLLLKSLRRGKALFAADSFGSLVLLIAVVILSYWAGIVGAAWGLAIGTLMKGTLKTYFALAGQKPQSPSPNSSHPLSDPQDLA